MIRRPASWFGSWTCWRLASSLEHGPARKRSAVPWLPRRLQLARVDRERLVGQVVRNQALLDLRINGAATKKVEKAGDLTLSAKHPDRCPRLEDLGNPAMNCA